MKNPNYIKFMKIQSYTDEVVMDVFQGLELKGDDFPSKSIRTVWGP
jgi:hypothetical protein